MGAFAPEKAYLEFLVIAGVRCSNGYLVASTMALML
jgi:hypothetical protein